MIRSEFMAALKQVATERGIQANEVLETLKHAMLAAYRKDYPGENEEEELDIEVEIDKQTGEVTLLYKGKDITPPGFGRIAAQTAKQVILQGVREAEKQAMIEEFKDKVGKVIPGMLQRFDRGLWFVDVGRTVALMPKDEQTYSEDYRNNQRMKFYIKEIRDRDGKSDVVVSRTDSNLVAALFEMEVPEVQSKAVVIKKIAREPGSRTKIAVTSTQEGVDPVGSMVGQRGVRVQAVTNELNGEKMDIILWSENQTKFIINALAPAQVIDVTIDEKAATAQVEVKDDQLSLAIGKDGQNVRLASKLTGYKIDIIAESGEKISVDAKDEDKTELDNLGLSTRTVNALHESGIRTVAELSLLSDDQLQETPGIGDKSIDEIKEVLATTEGKKEEPTG